MPKREMERRQHDQNDLKNKKKYKIGNRKKSRKRRSRSSSTSSASIQSSVKLLKVLEERRLKDHLENKRIREEMKTKETPEEKRSRRLMEKQAKELRRRQRMGWDTEYQQYTNQDNPFGDSNLTSTFVWNKKLEKEGLRGVSLETVEVLSRNKQLENKLELEKVKKRRQERESERQAREDDMILQQRSKEAAQFQEWERQEDQFHLEQARLRSIIRIQDGRAKPIDLLAQYVSNSKFEDSIEMQMHEPYVILSGLSVKDLEDLLIDIKVYVELEKGNNNDFWDDMVVIVEDELHKLKKQELTDEQDVLVAGRREGIHQSVVIDVSNIFRGKSISQLDKLRNRIEFKINAGSDGVDISYWESLLSQLKAHMARVRLRDRHQENLKTKLEMLKTIPDGNFEIPTTSNSTDQKQVVSDDQCDSELMVKNLTTETTKDNILDMCFRQYEDGKYSPKYLSLSDIDDTVDLITEKEDEERILKLRLQFIEKRKEERIMTQEELKMQREARKGMLGDEAEFSVEAQLDAPLQLTCEKYRPRKPRYFNRVHTGFEWNKYNQTHYDMDNPPPKIVQGYKFNIFYPDLIEKTITPQYFLTPCEDNSDFAVLRFHAGPPYEDIAFKIVNREWEFSYKRGFRCQFHNNIFQLWFHFKRYRYRR